MGSDLAEEGFKYLESFTNLEKTTSLYEREYRLDRVKYLFESFGSPHKEINLIHIAGSKGKGSTAAFAASILESTGFKTGLYASPHLLTYRERITLSGIFFSDDVYIENINLIRDFIENNVIPFESPPTTFELLTLLAFMIFRSQNCSWAVIETGIGGRLDATNIITPLCSVITPIEFEHQDILGRTLEKIASEKAGIIKQGVPAVTSVRKKAALEVLKARAESTHSVLTVLSETALISDISLSFSGTLFSVSFTAALLPEITLNTALIGGFQAENAVLALLSTRTALLRKEKYPGDRDFLNAAAEGIKKTCVKGRIEYIPAGITAAAVNATGRINLPEIILDSSHTPDSARKLAETITAIDSSRKRVLVFGSIEGKDHMQMLEILSGAFSEIIISTPGKFKKSSPETIYNDFRKKKSETALSLETEPENALIRAAEKAGRNGLIVVTGSFYMAGEIKKIIQGGFCGISA